MTKAITIWKYGIPIQGEFTKLMPINAVPLCVQLQDGEPTMWAHVFPEAQPVQTKFRIFGTGHPIPSDVCVQYVGTFQKDGFVWHLFKEIE